MDLTSLKAPIEKMYNELARFLVNEIDLYEKIAILEGGCGRGQLTIPLLKLIGKEIEHFNYFAIDLSSGPYKNSSNALKEKLVNTKWNNKVEVVEGDVRSLNAIKDQFFSLIISNELFCDLERKGLEKALKEFYRVLKPNGQMCHCELISFPSNYAQELFIKADSYSSEILTPKYIWFSPCADEVVALMHKIRFKEFKIKYFDTNVSLTFTDALEELKGWGLDEKFLKNYNDDLKKYGLEYPLTHVIICRK